MRSYIDGMLRYFEFSGRSTRRQYWLFFVVATLLCAAALYADYALYGIVPSRRDMGPWGLFASIVHIVPGITVTIRRLHDIDRSGWWYFVQLIPIVGSIVLLVWMCWGAEPGENRFGADPRQHGPALRPAGTAASSIPRQVRMGSQIARPAYAPADGEGVQRFI